METPQKPSRSVFRKIRFFVLLILILGVLAFIGIKFYYPYGEGVKTGQLNYVVHKGLLFKTYEGKLVQSGFWSSGSGALQSNEFVFSVSEKQVADSLMHAGGSVVELHYTEYLGTLPWRGYSRYVVDRIIRISPSSPNSTLPPAPAAQ